MTSTSAANVGAPLPPGWTAATDPATGDVYYQNNTTTPPLVQWEDPRIFLIAALPATSATPNEESSRSQSNNLFTSNPARQLGQENPPTYDQAISSPPSLGRSTNANAASTSSSVPVQASARYPPPTTEAGLQDELGPLPKGWIKIWDPKSMRWYFVDELATPPSVTWNDPRFGLPKSKSDGLSSYAPPPDTRLHNQVEGQRSVIYVEKSGGCGSSGSQRHTSYYGHGHHRHGLFGFGGFGC